MRLKLHLNDLPASSDKRKVCFLVNKELCRKVADLAHIIMKRFFTGVGVVSLYLDEFYCPPQEEINVIKDNDILTVRFTKFASQSNGRDTTVNEMKKRKIQESSSSSSSSSSSESDSDEEKGKKLLLPNLKKTLTSNGKTRSTATAKKNNSDKKNLPLSQLGFNSNKRDKSSSSSDSSSDESESKIQISKIKGNCGSKVTKTAINNKNANDHKVFKKPAPVVSKSKKESSSSDSSSSSSSSSSDSDSEDEISIVNKTREISKIDFNVSNLSKLPTSTPFPTPSPILKCNSSNSSSKLTTNKNKNRKTTPKQLAKNDVYKNVSEFLCKVTDETTASNVTDSVIDLTSPVYNLMSSNNEKLDLSTTAAEKTNGEISNSHDIQSPNSDENTKIDTNHISGRTLRNRRRRQRRLELIRNKKNGIQGDDTTTSKGNDSHGIDEIEKMPAVNPPLQKETHEVTANGVSEKVLLRDYSTYPELKDEPTVGSLIAYKILEMSQSYTPEVSAYKEAIVSNFDKDTNNMVLKLSEASLQKVRGDGNVTDRFEITMNDEEENNGEEVQDDVVVVSWNDLREVRLIL